MKRGQIMSKVIKGVNDLLSVNSMLALQWNYKKNVGVLPSDVAVNSNKKYWWICEKGHEWEANVNSRNRGNGCPVCSNRIILKGYNDLASQNPELADEWNYEKNTKSPEEVCYKSNDRYWWKCKICHNEWQTSLYDRYKGTGCPFCSGRRPIKGINDIATTNPELISEWDFEKNKNLTPYDVSAGSSRRIWWKCKYGHKWRTIVSVRTKMHTGCPTCAKNNVQGIRKIAILKYFLIQ